MMLVFWGSLLLLVWVLVAKLPRRHRDQSARDILDERFARGELTMDEYEEKRATLEGRPSAHR